MDFIFALNRPLGINSIDSQLRSYPNFLLRASFEFMEELFQHRDQRMVVSMSIQELDLQGTTLLSHMLYLRSPICLLNPGLMETTCSSLCVPLLSRSPGKFKNQARAKLNNFGVGARGCIPQPESLQNVSGDQEGNPISNPGAKPWPSPAESGGFTRCCPCWNKGALCIDVAFVIKRKK